MPRTSEEWIAQHAQSHTHPVNRTLHTLGIPMIAVAVLLWLPTSCRGSGRSPSASS